ncbi:MAG: hypothetical protein RJQ14_24415, partial [Marinoscillum sp.]
GKKDFIRHLLWQGNEGSGLLRFLSPSWYLGTSLMGFNEFRYTHNDSSLDPTPVTRYIRILGRNTYRGFSDLQ